MLLRFPFIRAAELRLGLGTIVTTSPAGSRETGVADITVGTKIRLSAGDGSALSPTVAAILASSLPTGSDAIGSDGAD